MDPKVKKCPKCKQLLEFNGLPKRGNIPLFLPCGHTVCAACIHAVVKENVPFECTICRRRTDFNLQDREYISNLELGDPKLYKWFPINLFALGELFHQPIEPPKDKFKGEACHVNVKALLDKIEACIVCQKNTNQMCQQCSQILCNECFHEIHTSKGITSHVLQNTKPGLGPYNCEIHKGKPLNHYCNDCTKPVCVDCLATKIGCDHLSVVDIETMNDSFIEKLSDISPKIDETFRRLTKTAVDIGELLINIADKKSSVPDLKQTIVNIDHEYSKMLYTIQKQKSYLISEVMGMQDREKASLFKAKAEITSAIIKTKAISDMVLSSLRPALGERVNLAALLREAERMAETPCFLYKAARSNITMNVLEPLRLMQSEFIHIQGGASSYRIGSIQELPEGMQVPPPPTEPVLPEGQLLKSKTPAAYGQQQINDRDMLVYMSHVVSPHKFFVQLVRDQPGLNTLLSKFTSAQNSLLTPTLDQIAEGDIFLVINHEPGYQLWMRCRVVRVAIAAMVTVFCIDYGNTMVVHSERLRVMLPSWTDLPPPLAIQCSLANCKSKKGLWPIEATSFMHRIIDNSEILLHVVGTRRASRDETVIYCNMTVLDRNISVIHALVFHDLATIIDENIQYPVLPVLSDPKIPNCASSYFPDSVEGVHISYVSTPDKFYIRKVHLDDAYRTLCLELGQHYIGTSLGWPVYLPVVGMSCVVTIYQVWSRAKVIRLMEDRTVVVRLVDTGSRHRVDWKKLRYIDPKFCVENAYAAECYLAGVIAPGMIWRPESTAILSTYHGVMSVQEIEQDRGALGIILKDRESGVCLNAHMVNLKFAISFGMYQYHARITADEVTIYIPTPNDPIYPLNLRYLEEKRERRYKGEMRLEAKLLKYESPSMFYVSTVHSQAVSYRLEYAMQRHYSKLQTLESRAWVVGDMCCTLCTLSMKWRRVIILEMVGNNAKVFYADYTGIDVVPITSLTGLLPEFLEVRHGAMRCHLNGIVPISGRHWSATAKEYLKELLSFYDRFFLTIMSKTKANESVPVELAVYDIYSGNNQVHLRSLNDMIIDQGFGVAKGRLQMAGYCSQFTSSSLIDPPYKFYWKSAELTPNKELTALPILINTDGEIFLQDASLLHVLEQIKMTLALHFDDLENDASSEDWDMGDACIALSSSSDKLAYRGSIAEVRPDTCLVYLVDYGHFVAFSYENIKKKRVLSQLPAQAYRCFLHRVRPITGQWDDHAIEYVEQAIIGKECFVKVIDKPFQGIIPIELECDGLLINDLLVDLGMATYGLPDSFIPQVPRLQVVEFQNPAFGLDFSDDEN